ncbi:MAG: nuclear transport factor 2 family protein [Actinobacteria bacterium]|nr:nuclear transport factor 2 family protein [Actinomycetota bacterium]
MRADTETEAAVMRSFDELWKAYETRDGDRLLSLFVPDGDVLLYGTGADEKRVGPAEIRANFERDWSQSETAYLSFDWHSVSSAGEVALVGADGAAHVRVEGQDVTMPVRATMAFERRGEKWLVAQMHVSTPAGEQAEGESWVAPSG